MKKTLKVKAVGDALVQNYQALQFGSRRYIGRRHEFNAGKCDFDGCECQDGKVQHSAWVLTGEVEEVPNIREYREEVKLGNLEAADYETAVACGVRAITYVMV